MNYKKTTKAELIKDHRSLVQKLAAAQKKLQSANEQNSEKQKGFKDILNENNALRAKLKTMTERFESAQKDTKSLETENQTLSSFSVRAKNQMQELRSDLNAATSVAYVNQISLIQCLKALHRARFMLNAYAVMVAIIIGLYFVLPIAVVGILAVLFVLTSLMIRPAFKAEWQDNADAESWVYSETQKDKNRAGFVAFCPAHLKARIARAFFIV